MSKIQDAVFLLYQFFFHVKFGFVCFFTLSSPARRSQAKVDTRLPGAIRCWAPAIHSLGGAGFSIHLSFGSSAVVPHDEKKWKASKRKMECSLFPMLKAQGGEVQSPIVPRTSANPSPLPMLN